MKADIHPKYVDAEIRCACGNVIKTRSTRPTIIVGICNACHPFYTGQQKFVDTAGRVDKFQQRMAKTQAAQAAAWHFANGMSWDELAAKKIHHVIGNRPDEQYFTPAQIRMAMQIASQAEVMAKDQAGYFIHEWQELRDQVRTMMTCPHSLYQS